MSDQRQSGFTLLEIMVALAIMAVLSLLTAQALKSGVENRAFVSSELSRDSQLADTLRIMRADIGQAFHYHNVFCDMDRDVNSTPTPANNDPADIPIGGIQVAGAAAQQQRPANGTGATPKPCPPDTSGFIGDGESLYFTALSNVRTLRDSQESDQAKIGYFVKSCKSHGKNGVNTKCLYRAVSPYLDEEVDKPGPETLLLENVEEFKLRYLGPERDEFVDTWKFGKNGDAISKDKFPYAVEITLTIHDKSNKKDRPATQTVLAPISFENNPKKKKTADPNARPSATPPKPK